MRPHRPMPGRSRPPLTGSGRDVVGRRFVGRHSIGRGIDFLVGHRIVGLVDCGRDGVTRFVRRGRFVARVRRLGFRRLGFRRLGLRRVERVENVIDALLGDDAPGPPLGSRVSLEPSSASTSSAAPGSSVAAVEGDRSSLMVVVCRCRGHNLSPVRAIQKIGSVMLFPAAIPRLRVAIGRR